MLSRAFSVLGALARDAGRTWTGEAFRREARRLDEAGARLAMIASTHERAAFARLAK